MPKVKIKKPKSKKVINGKKAFAKQMHSLCPDYHTYEYEDFLDIFLEAIEYCCDGETTVAFPNFGKFETKKRAAYSTTGGVRKQLMHVPAFSYLSFVPAPMLRRRYFNRTKQGDVVFENETYEPRANVDPKWSRIGKNKKGTIDAVDANNQEEIEEPNSDEAEVENGFDPGEI